MRRVALTALLALGLAVPASSARTEPVVPRFTQRLVKLKAGSLAYVPTRVPFRYRYLSYGYDKVRRIVTIRAADRRYPLNGRHTLVFTARRFAGTLASCGEGKQKSFQLDGNKVFWDGTLAWRCVRGPDGKLVRLAAAGPNLPDVALGQVVASGKRIR